MREIDFIDDDSLRERVEGVLGDVSVLGGLLKDADSFMKVHTLQNFFETFGTIDVYEY